jgi:hypothetical protein
MLHVSNEMEVLQTSIWCSGEVLQGVSKVWGPYAAILNHTRINIGNTLKLNLDYSGEGFAEFELSQPHDRNVSAG